MQWVTVASTCRMQFRAWPLDLKAKWGSWRGRRWSCRGNTDPPLPLCLCLLLPVSQPWRHSDGEQLMEGNTFHSNHSNQNLMQSVHTSVWRILVSGGKQMPNNRCRLYSALREPTQCFPTTERRSQRLVPCKSCKTADFLDTRRGRYDSLYKH